MFRTVQVKEYDSMKAEIARLGDLVKAQADVIEAQRAQLESKSLPESPDQTATFPTPDPIDAPPIGLVQDVVMTERSEV